MAAHPPTAEQQHAIDLYLTGQSIRPEPADRADGDWCEPFDGDTGAERDAMRHDDGRDLSEDWRI